MLIMIGAVCSIIILIVIIVAVTCCVIKCISTKNAGKNSTPMSPEKVGPSISIDPSSS